MNTDRRMLLGTLAAITCATALWACGPHFPNWLLDQGEAEMLRSPKAIFASELARLTGLRPSPFKAVISTNDHATEALTAELEELEQALARTGLPLARQQATLTEYEDERQRLNRLRTQVEEWRSWTIEDAGRPAPVWEQPRIPAGIPREFAGYLEGAIEFAVGRTNEAGVAWQRVLELPETERHHRSVWAAFMLGKLAVDNDPVAAGIHFRHTRELARGGFADRLGLAASSLGWEARAALRQQDHARAVDLYLEQAAAGQLDVASLRRVASEASRLDAAGLQRLAAHPGSRRVITAFLISTAVPGGERADAASSRNWLAAIQAAGVVDPEAADQFALAAYQAGEFELAQQWLVRAPANGLATLWLRAKLSLREGDLDAAAALLAEAARRLPESASDPATPRPAGLADHLEVDHDSAAKRVRGELGVLRLQRREYSEALDLLLRAGYRADAHFLADRVLTVDELKTYVDRHWFAVDEMAAVDDATFSEKQTKAEIRHLLARRLTRASRFAEARSYFPEHLRAEVDQLRAELVVGNDPRATPSVRARSYRQAAMRVRHQGLELMGTALEPDWQIYGGNFEYGGPRLAIRTNLPPASGFQPTEDEVTRALTTAPHPDKRFHHRYVAAELAWAAAELMPDQSDETARLLITAGGWVKVRDPRFADRFYKALVIRCGRTELGTAADRKRWFPQMDENGQLAEAMPPPVVSTYSGPWPGDEGRR